MQIAELDDFETNHVVCLSWCNQEPLLPAGSHDNRHIELFFGIPALAGISRDVFQYRRGTSVLPRVRRMV